MLPGIFSLVLISCINMGLMAVLGVNLFMGTFYSCDMSNIPGQLQGEVANMWDCMDYGGEWVNAEQNFDKNKLAVALQYERGTDAAPRGKGLAP